MALVNLTTQYATLKWDPATDGGVPHTDYSANNTPESAQAKFNLIPSSNQYQFYNNNLKNKGLDQIESVKIVDGKQGSGLGYLKTSMLDLSFGKPPFITSDASGSTNSDTGDFFPSPNNPGLEGDYRRRVDESRILSFMNTTAGVNFVQKQKLLGLTNPRMETGKSNLSGVILENTRAYSKNNTVRQAGMQGTGAHLSRLGDAAYSTTDMFYAETVGLQNVYNNASTNRLLLLNRLKMRGGVLGNMFSNGVNGFINGSIDVSFAKSLGVSLDPNLIFNYSGGPNSLGDRGDTIVGRYTDTTYVYSPMVMNYNEIAKQTSIKGAPINATNIQDFRANTQAVQPAWDYANNSLEYRIGTGNFGQQNKPLNYTVKIPGATDALNAMYPVVFNNLGGDPYENNDMLAKLGGVKATDIIKFGFECMSNDQNVSTALFFRAFLTNGFTDSNAANLTAFKYMGRGEDFFTYQGFSRTIGFSFKIAAFSRSELRPLYNKLNNLISQVYPDYSDGGIMRAPLVKVTIGDYLYRVPGFLESVNVTADNATPWEINLEGDPGTDVLQLPHVVEVSVSFKPIHSILPKRQTEKQDNAASGSVPVLVGRSGFIDPVKTLKVDPLSLAPLNTFATPIPTSPNPYQPGNGLDITGTSLDFTKSAPGTVPGK